MKTKSLMIVVALFALFIGMGSSAYAAVTITPIISTDAAGKDPIATIAPGQRFFVNVQVSDVTGLAGAALTLTYDTTLFEVIQHVSGQPLGTAIADNTEVNSANTTGTILDSDILATVSDNTGAAIGIFRIGKVVSSTNPGKVMLSGAAINGTTGTGPSTEQNKNIFRVRFRAKAASGTGTFALQDTVLTNTAAGWTGTAVPALVGALAKTDANFTDMTKAFPAIAYSYGTAVSLTIQGVPGVVRIGATSTSPTLGDVIYFYNHYKCLSTPTASSCTTVKSIAGNGDFSHNGGIDLGDVLMLFYYYKGQPPAANPTLE